MDCGVGDVEILAKRHSYAKYCFFLSKRVDSPPEVTNKPGSGVGGWLQTGNSAGLASATTERIKEMMTNHAHWVQVCVCVCDCLCVCVCVCEP